MLRCVLAVDIGGTTVKGALVDENGRSHAARSRPSLQGDATVAVIQHLLTELEAAAVAAGLRPVAAGVVTPGIVDAATGTVAYASNLAWHDLDLRSALHRVVAVPVSVGHDVRAAGRAEALVAGVSDPQDFVLVQLGTGISAGLISAGRLVTGVGNAAGEVGHMPVRPGGERCTCGQRGCLEVYVSGAGIARRYHRAGGDAAATAVDVVARLGIDPVADRVWADAVAALAIGLTTLTMTLDPAAVVLGGGVSRSGAALLEPLAAAMSDVLVWRSAPPILTSALGPVAGRIGAAIEAYACAALDAVTAGWTLADVLDAAP